MIEKFTGCVCDCGTGFLVKQEDITSDTYNNPGIRRLVSIVYPYNHQSKASVLEYKRII